MNHTNGAEGLYAQLAELRARIEALENAGPFGDKMVGKFWEKYKLTPATYEAIGKPQIDWPHNPAFETPFEPGESAVPQLVKYEGEK